MALIKCKVCGGELDLSADMTVGMCRYCGCTMTFPKIDDEQRAAAFNRGNHFRRIGEFDKALAVYERIVREDESDAEAHWCCALCRFGIEYVEDPTTFEWLPTCHRASFDSFLEDVDYLAAVEHSEGLTRRQYQKDAAKIAEVQRGILATSQNTEPYDVFICYKESDENGNRTVDSTLAQDIYYQLTEQGRKVFFSRITLEDVAGTQYEPYIFAALNSAQVMVVVGTKPEYLNAVWVRNEWSRFLAMMKKDHHKLLLPCYRGMDPYDLPEQLSVLQSYDMAKIGFIQDLIRGVSKVLDAERKPVAAETAGMTANSGNVEAFLDRAFLFLEDREWDRADEYLEKVLDTDPRNARAYLAKLMIQLKKTTPAELAGCPLPFDANANYQKAIRFGDDTLRAELYGYIEAICNREKESIYQQASGLMNANDRKSVQQALAMFEQIRGYRDAEQKIEQIYLSQRESIYQQASGLMNANDRKSVQQALAMFEQIRGYRDAEQKIEQIYLRQRESIYQQACDHMNNGTECDLREAVSLFEKLQDYKDVPQLLERCRAALADVETIRQEETKAEIYRTACLKMQHARTEQAYNEAAAMFEQIKDYKDAAQMMERCYLASKIVECERTYACAWQMMKYACVKSEYLRAAELFGKVSEYKDAAKRCEEAKILAAQATAVDENRLNAARTASQNQRAKNQILAIGLAALVAIFLAALSTAMPMAVTVGMEVVAIAIVFCYISLIEPKKAYDGAMKNMQCKKYYEALAAFQMLGKYRDSEELSMQCKQLLEKADE